MDQSNGTFSKMNNKEIIKSECLKVYVSFLSQMVLVM